MKPSFLYRFAALIVILAGCSNLFGQEPDSIPALTIDPQSSIGALGLQPGTIVHVRGSIVDGDETGYRAHMGSYLLRVEKIEGQPVKDEIVLSFEDRTGTVPNTDFKLNELVHGKTTGVITHEELQALKKQFVGKTLDLVLYETGHFIGFPQGYFDYQPLQSGTGFHFENYLVIISNKHP